MGSSEVVVTRKGQTTIPSHLRKKFKIEEGTRLEVIETKEGILFKPKISFWDPAGPVFERLFLICLIKLRLAWCSLRRGTA